MTLTVGSPRGRRTSRRRIPSLVSNSSGALAGGAVADMRGGRASLRCSSSPSWSRSWPSEIAAIPADAAARLLGVSDEKLVGEEGEAVTDGLGVDEAHGLLVAGLAEEALASPEHDREDDQPQLVDQVVLH
jgi:hypothetical protein